MKKSIFPILMFATLLPAAARERAVPPYRDASLPVAARVRDLLGRMTLDEKVGQLRCELAWDYYNILPGRKGVVPSASFKRDLREKRMGQLWATFRADPWTRKTLDTGLDPRLAAECANALQRYAIDSTRLGIPLFLAEEAPHGHMAIGTTVFPTGFGMAASWDTTMMRRVGAVIAREVRAQGAHISYGPVIDLCREPRWSRVEENMGEDPYLVGQMAAAEVRGLGGGRIGSPTATIATLKHFVGYGTTEGGHNGAPTYLGKREIRQKFLLPFRMATRAGALSVMTSYNNLDGVPSSCDDYYLDGVLRREWRFPGFVVSDLYSIDNIALTHHVAPDLMTSGALALKAGCDIDLGGRSYARLADAVRQGLVAEAEVDTAVARVLSMKFEMGLFERPYVDPRAAASVAAAEGSRAVAREVAAKSVTLLKNNGVLPLNPQPPAPGRPTILLTGPNADNVYNMLGDYTAQQAPGHVKTVRDGLRRYFGDDHIIYVKGCAVRDTVHEDIAEAVRAARRADVIVAVVGGSSARDFKTSYKETGAAETDPAAVSDMESGEGYDRATLGLMGLQGRLLRALKQTGKPLVVVYIEGRPLLKNWAAENADALLTAYYPGEEGGNAIADVLTGACNPAGRLPISVPRSVGQLPVYYDKMATPASYVEESGLPLYSFGYGLSYSTFAYRNLTISPLRSVATNRELSDAELVQPVWRVSFDVTNTSQRDGEEVPQLYLHDDLASTAQPVMQLRGFDRRMIRAGQTERFSFDLRAEDLTVVDRQMRTVVEPGTFTVMVGPSSDHIALRGGLEVGE